MLKQEKWWEKQDKDKYWASNRISFINQTQDNQKVWGDERLRGRWQGKSRTRPLAHFHTIQIQRDKSCKQKAVANFLPECFSENLNFNSVLNSHSFPNDCFCSPNQVVASSDRVVGECGWEQLGEGGQSCGFLSELLAVTITDWRCHVCTEGRHSTTMGGDCHYVPWHGDIRHPGHGAQWATGHTSETV